jgi:hypothetical protein
MHRDTLYSNSVVIDLSRYGSDHCPLLLQTSVQLVQHSNLFRFEVAWIEIDELNLLVVR